MLMGRGMTSQSTPDALSYQNSNKQLQNFLMAFLPSRNLQESGTIEYIKQLMKTLENQSIPPSPSNSLILSDSQTSQTPSEASLKLPLPSKPPKLDKYARNYQSPYKQEGISMRRIEASGRMQLSPEVNFENTLLQITTSREKLAKREGRASSRYMAAESLMDRLDSTTLDRVRKEARKVHELKEKQRMEMTPRQSNERWADFLLRERKWEEERQRREIDIRKEAFQQQRKLSNRPSPTSRPPTGLSRENIIRKVKREHSKLQERLRDMSAKSYKYKYVNIRAPRPTSPGSPKWVVVSDPQEARFLMQRN